MKFILKRWVSFSLASFLKILVRCFYRVEVKWMNQPDYDPWKDVRLAALLNHTSLFEPLFIAAFPFRFIWRASAKIAIPVADKTMKRPIVGLFYKFLTPKTVSITRKRDNSWSEVIDQVEDDRILAILPEGRMKRLNGLDSEGKPMSVRGGIADLLAKMNGGTLILMYSGGLHHVQAPGQRLPKLFKTIRINYEAFQIVEYKKLVGGADHHEFKKNVIADLEARQRKNCPVKNDDQ